MKNVEIPKFWFGPPQPALPLGLIFSNHNSTPNIFCLLLPFPKRYDTKPWEEINMVETPFRGLGLTLMASWSKPPAQKLLERSWVDPTLFTLLTSLRKYENIDQIFYL